MKLSRITIEVLRNFATINQGLLFKPGKVLRTMNVMKTTFAVAEFPDDIPQEFAIYDLNEFLLAYSLAENCDIEFKDTMLVLNSNGESTKYNYSSPSVVVSPGDRTIKLPSEDKKFLLTKEVFDKVQKVSSALKLKDVVIDCNGIEVLNRNTIGHKHHIKVSVDCASGPETQSFMKVENLKLIPVDYDVVICQKGLVRFTSRSDEYRVEYHVALEAD